MLEWSSACCYRYKISDFNGEEEEMLGHLSVLLDMVSEYIYTAC